MRNIIVTMATIFTLIYSQIVFAAGGVGQALRPLGEMVSSYNSMRNNPSLFLESLDKESQKVYQDILKQGKIKELPEMVKVKEGTYQLQVGENKVVFDEKNWNQKKIIINNFSIDLSKITSVYQLMETLNQVLSHGPKTTSMFQFIGNFLIPRAYSIDFGWNLQTGVFVAGILAVLGVGYFVYKDKKDNKEEKKSSSSSAATSAPTVSTPSPHQISDDDGKSCSQMVGFVWKMNKEGNTAVLVNKKYSKCSIRTNGRSPNVGGGVMDDGRPYFRYKGHPTQFGPTAKVEVVCNSKVEETIKIPNTGKRCSYYPGGWGD